MTLAEFLPVFILLPATGFVVSLAIPERREQLISNVAFGTVLLQLLGILGFTLAWGIGHMQGLNVKEVTLVKNPNYEFFIDFCFDKVTAVYLLMGAILTLLVTTYSRYYLHREKGYKRFFNTVLFFFFGYNLALLAGNFETLFMGWEIIGLASFLLIAFYRERYLPVKNAIKVFSVYRIGDIGIILAMWASHHLWHENITFIQLHNAELVHEHLQSHSLIGVFISLAIALAAAAKSAQLPFSSWLPRAMEGPTPSSAIFYGSLSVHLGLFLMLRTFPFWEHQTSVRIAVALMGLCTSVAATFMARVQSTVKSQIAYSSISQIGLIFIEIAAGFDNLALVHIAGNAFLRTYQLLVSPSVVSYLIREQFYTFEPKARTFEDSLPKKLEYSLYVLSLKEFKLESLMDQLLWLPLKRLGRQFNFLTLKLLYLLFVPTYLLGLLCYAYRAQLPQGLAHSLPDLFAALGLVLIFKAYAERRSPFMAWMLLLINYCWISLAISFNEELTMEELALYLSGIAVSGIVGYLALLRLHTIEGPLNLNQHLGHAYEHPRFAFFFLIALLGVTGFPITSTFVGEDLIFSHIRSDQVVLAFLVSLSFIVAGIAGIRLYARLFLGPHCKTYHEMPYHTS